MTAMDIKVLMPRLIFWGVLIGVVITLFNMCAPGEPEKLLTEPKKQITEKQNNVITSTGQIYIVNRENGDTVNLGRRIPPILISQIAWAETDVPGNTSEVYLIDNKTRILTIPIKELHERVGGESNCFIYSKGRKDEKSFMFSVKHVINCVTKREDNYDRNIKLKGDWKLRINKDTAGKLRGMIGKCPNECGELCCKPKKH